MLILMTSRKCKYIFNDSIIFTILFKRQLCVEIIITLVSALIEIEQFEMFSYIIINNNKKASRFSRGFAISL